MTALGRKRPEIILASIQRRRVTIGPNTHTDQFERLLKAAGLQVRVLTPFSRFRIVGLPILAARRLIDLVSKPVGLWLFIYLRRQLLRLSLSRALRQGQAAVIYARCPNSAQAALKARKHAAQKVVLAVHFNRSEAEEWNRAGRIKYGDWLYRDIVKFESELLPKVDGLHYVSRFMRDYIHEHHPRAAKCQSILLPNFLEDPGNAPKSEPTGDLISIGSLEWRKNQVYLIRVIHEARQFGYKYSLTLVGDGPDRRALKRLARQLGVFDQVQFLGSKRNAAQLLPAYRAYAHSALIENCPFVLIESAAYGLPILAGPVGGVPEVFANGKHGFYWTLDDPTEGARKLISLLEDQSTYARLAQGARERFEAKFTAERVGPRLIDFLLGMAGPQSDARL
jgi:glycosyltransferase involved in cell wall biosynthesis